MSHNEVLDWAALGHEYAEKALPGGWPQVTSPQYALSGAFTEMAREIERLRALATTPSPNASSVSGVANPVAYRHTMHMEGGQTQVRVNEWDGIDPDYPRRTGFGIPGRDYSEEYAVTIEPLYLHPSRSLAIVKEAGE